MATWSVVNGDGDGAHAGDTLVETMLALQVFNAAVALFCLCFGALVTERLRSQEALEDAAANLEERVRVSAPRSWRRPTSGSNTRCETTRRPRANGSASTPSP